MRKFLEQSELEKIHAYWLAANYLCAGKLYLKDNVLLEEPLKPEHIKTHCRKNFKTLSVVNLIYSHLNRIIKNHQINISFIASCGCTALNVNAYLEGVCIDLCPGMTQDKEGIKQLFRQLPMPDPLDDREDLGSSLMHAYGAAFDQPDLLVVCLITDKEAETAPLAGSWKGNQFLIPDKDGTVLPIVHLDGEQASATTILASKSEEELIKYFTGQGFQPFIVEGKDTDEIHESFAKTLENCCNRIHKIQTDTKIPSPLIVLRTPKEWNGPKEELLADASKNPVHREHLEEWLLSFTPDRHFDSRGTLAADLQELIPENSLRIGPKESPLKLPSTANCSIEVTGPGRVIGSMVPVLSEYLKTVLMENAWEKNFRLFSPEAAISTCFESLFASSSSDDVAVSFDDRIMQVFSDHLCQGWQEGYALSGRHGLNVASERSLSIVGAMIHHYSNWLAAVRKVSWKKNIPSLNYLISSEGWKGSSAYARSGFLGDLLELKTPVIKIFFPPDVNSLLATAEQCLKSENALNIIAATAQPTLQWLTLDEAREHCARGISIWNFASNDLGKEPDVVFASIGASLTTEAVAAAWLMRQYLPELRLRVVNIVDLLTLATCEEHPHGLDQLVFENIFGETAPVVLAFEGRAKVVEELIAARPKKNRFYVQGCTERRIETTSFDFLVKNQASRYHLAIQALRRSARFHSDAAYLIEKFERKLAEHTAYSEENFDDLPEVANWKWI